MIKSSALRNPFRSLCACAAAAMLSSCAGSGPMGQSVPCEQGKSAICREAVSWFAGAGYTVRPMEIDSARIRTVARKFESVTEISSHRPIFIVLEIEFQHSQLIVRGTQLIPSTRTYAYQHGLNPEDEKDVEERHIMPGERMFISQVLPLVEHLKEFCERR